MTTEPRDPALAALVRATVRVGTGSGVVIQGPSVPLIATAAHVFKQDELPMVRKGSVFGNASVVVRDPDLDLALVTPPIELEGFALELAEDIGRPGDSIWGAGFPGGWRADDPVIVPGTIAGLGEECWANLDGTWGHSGGPVCRIVQGKALVAGILRGRAGPVNRRLLAIRGTLASGALMGRLQNVVGKMEAMGIDVLLLRSLMSGQSSAMKTAEIILELLEEHFRTGFLRFAPIGNLRKLLGPGDDGPSR